MLKLNFFKKIKADTIGLDLGSTNTVIYSKKSKKFLIEKTIISNPFEDKYFYGNDVQKVEHFLQKTINPVRNGIICENKLSKNMINFFISKINEGQTYSLFHNNMIVGLPFQANEIEKNNMLELLELCNSKNVLFVYKNIASGLGANLQNSSIIIDIGGETTEMSLIFNNNIIENRYINLGGKDIDNYINEYIDRKYGVFIGRNIANKVKEQIGAVCLKKNTKQKEKIVYGRNLNSKKLEKITITQYDIVSACSEFTNLLIENLINLIDATPPELLEEIKNNSITLCGGSSQISGLDIAIKNATGIQTNIIKEPQLCLAKGLKKIIDNYNNYKHLLFSA